MRHLSGSEPSALPPGRWLLLLLNVHLRSVAVVSAFGPSRTAESLVLSASSALWRAVRMLSARSRSRGWPDAA